MVKRIAKIAIVSALYVALTLVLAPISYGVFQIRIAEALILLCLFKKDYCYSLVIGCLIANIFSPGLGFIDCLFGTLHTLLSVVLIRCTKNVFVATLIPTLLMFIIAIEMVIFMELDMNFFLIYLILMGGELVSVGVIGIPLYTVLSKNKYFQEKFVNN